MKKKRTSNFYFFLTLSLIAAFGLILRILWLDRVPVAIVDDELDYILDAKAIFFSGKDLSGEWSPLSLTTAPHQVPKAELPALLIAPFVGPMPLSLLAARLPYVIWGIVFLIILSLIARKFFGDKVALIVAAITTINPWSFYFSRTSFDIPLAGVFYLIAFYLLISLKGWKLLFAFPFLFLAFFSYLGTKLIFLPFLLVVCFYSWFFINKRKFTRQYFVLVLLSLCVFGWFLFSLQRQPVKARTVELLTPFHSLVTQRVDSERRLSTGNTLNLLFANKPVVFTKILLEKYLGIFSSNFLFLYGEERAPYSMWTHGMFYYLDLIFLILGFCFLFVKKRKLWLFLVALIAIAPLPAVFSTMGVEYALRGVLLYPMLILFIGLGIWFLIFLKKSKLYRLGMASLIVIFYLLQLFNFLNIYFFRNPIYNSEGFGLSQRVMINYVKRAQLEAKKVLVIEADELAMLKRYLFYTNSLDKEQLSLVRHLIAEDEYRWENVHFLRYYPKDMVMTKEITVIFQPGMVCLPSVDCLPSDEYPYWLSVTQLGDSGEVFRIINDPICYQFSLGRYSTGIKFNDFKVEEMPLERFCQKFIIDFTGYSDFEKKVLP